MEDFLLRVRDVVAKFADHPETSEEGRRIAADFLRDVQTVGDLEALPQTQRLRRRLREGKAGGKLSEFGEELYRDMGLHNA